MENKYYTPSIEEFHVGFEYQYKADKNTWVDSIINDFSDVTDSDGSMNSDIPWQNNPVENFRVKCLDKEDIEELGWKADKILNNHYTIGDIWKPDGKGGFLEFKNNKWKLTTTDEGYSQDGPNHSVKFHGIIKNKSELKRVMKQVNIVQ